MNLHPALVHLLLIAAAEAEPTPTRNTQPDPLDALIDALSRPSPAMEQLKAACSRPPSLQTSPQPDLQSNLLLQEVEKLSEQADALSQALQTLLKRIKPAATGLSDAG